MDSIWYGRTTLLLVTLIMLAVNRLWLCLALINRGELIVLDPPEAIAAQAGGKRVRFVPSKPVDDKTMYAIPGVKEIERKEAYVTVIGAGDLAASVIDSLTRIGVHVSDIEARGGNLDDAFVKLTRDDTSKVQERPQS